MANPFEQNRPQEEQKEGDSNKLEQARREAMKRLEGLTFKTEMMSVYTYDDQGRTSRFKTKTQEQCEKQDITVFLDLTEEEARLINDAIRCENPELKKKVYVAERMNNDESKIIRTFSEVNDPRNLYLAIYDKNGKRIGSKKATLKPTLGYTVFDTRHFKNGEQWETERHLGHKVVEIN